jgi:hypothetical protein
MHMTRTAEQLVELLNAQLCNCDLDTIPLKLEARLKSVSAEYNEWRVKRTRRPDEVKELKLVFAVSEAGVAGAHEDPDMHLVCTIWINPNMVAAETELVTLHRIVGLVQEACSSDVISLALEAARIDARAGSNGTPAA